MSDSEQPSPLVELTKTRLREFFREKGTVFWVFGFPILMALGLGLAFRNKEPDQPRIAVVAAADSALAGALLHSPRLKTESRPRQQALNGLAHAKYDLVVELEVTGVASLSPRPPVYHFDPMLQGASLARALVDAELQRAAGRQDVLTARDVTSSKPGTRYIDFLLPGLISMNIMGSSMWGVGYNLVVARKRKLLKRYAVTAMRRWHFLLSYFFSRSVFLVLELSILIAFGALVFDTFVQGSYLALSVLAVVGAAAFGGLSLLVGARVENTEIAQGWMNFLQLPMWVLSGTFFSYERFPEWLHAPIQALPLTALVDGFRLVYNEGASLMNIWQQLAVLGAWALLGFGAALKTFRWH